MMPRALQGLLIRELGEWHGDTGASADSPGNAIRHQGVKTWTRATPYRARTLRPRVGALSEPPVVTRPPTGTRPGNDHGFQQRENGRARKSSRHRPVGPDYLPRRLEHPRTQVAAHH